MLENPVMNTILEPQAQNESEQRLDAAKAALVGPLKRYIGPVQRSVLGDMLRGEERDHFATRLLEILKIVNSMPRTWETSGQGRDAIAHLHYFGARANWWLTELDIDEGQLDALDYDQAFGWANLYGGIDRAECGYISALEVTLANAELDLYWTPVAVKEIAQ
jgi:hypothetical protein